MKLLYIGAGFVGACSGAVMADSGHDALVYDIDSTRIKMLGSGDRDTIQACLSEDGLGEMIVRNGERIKFTDNYQNVIGFLDNVEAVFMCLPTPEKAGAEGQSDLTCYSAAAEKLGESLAGRNGGRQEKRVVVINKSTVPIKLIDETEEILKKMGAKNFAVVSNPEFLVEGKAIEGTVRPSRIVVGAWNKEDFAVMRKIYQRFYTAPNVKYIEVNPLEAAAGKLLANYVLFNRLATTYDVIGRVAERFSKINFENLRQVLTTDERIGKWGFYDSVYAGGSCFIKDAASLAHQLEEAGANAALIRQTLASNRFQRDHFLSRAKEAGFEWSGKSVAILGVAFKRDTNDVRNSPALDLTEYLVDAGVKEIRVYDPSAVPMFKSIFNPEKDARFAVISYHETEEKALLASEASIILTDWPQFRSLGEKIAKICKPPYLIMDGRRMIAHQYEELAAAGYAIIAVGSPLYKSL